MLNNLPDNIPTPVIKIDNQHDPFATVVTIEYGDRLGELLDTVSLFLSDLIPELHLIAESVLYGLCAATVESCCNNSLCPTFYDLQCVACDIMS